MIRNGQDTFSAGQNIFIAKVLRAVYLRIFKQCQHSSWYCSAKLGKKVMPVIFVQPIFILSLVASLQKMKRQKRQKQLKIIFLNDIYSISDVDVIDIDEIF